MSGIVAMFSGARPVDAEALARATRVLAHRGPDDHRTWIAPARSTGLGHARLATDAAGHDQPARNEDETIRAVLDGSLYERERLRHALTGRGHRLRDASDAELLVHLYEEHGASFVEHLRGEFALVIHDSRRDLLIAARDRCGVKPLAYARLAGGLVLASEAKAVLAAGLPAAWDVEAFLQTCVLGGPLEDRTIFAGVRRIPPGHVMIASRDACRLVRYWDFDYPVMSDASTRDQAEDHAALAAALDDAVRLRVRAEAPNACYLGGLDASTVLGLAQRHAASPLQAFTYTIGDHLTEENALAHDLAVRTGVVHTAVEIRPGELARDLEHVVYFAERPLNHLGSVLLFQLGRAVRDAGHNTILTGEGSDELFAGYAHFRGDLMLAPDGARPGGASRPAGDRPPGISLAGVRAGLGGRLPTWVRALALGGRGILEVLRVDLATRLARGEPFFSLVSGLEVSRQLRGRHPLHQAMYLWSKALLPNQILSANNDAIQMAHGVECRLPFLDHHVIELSTRLPIDRLIRGQVEKYLLREVARPVVGDAIYRRPKDKIIPPEALALEAGVVGELVHDTLRSSTLREMPLFDHARLIGLVDALPDLPPADRAAAHGPLLLAITACLLQQRFGLSG